MEFLQGRPSWENRRHKGYVMIDSHSVRRANATSRLHSSGLLLPFSWRKKTWDVHIQTYFDWICTWDALASESLAGILSTRGNHPWEACVPSQLPNYIIANMHIVFICLWSRVARFCFFLGKAQWMNGRIRGGETDAIGTELRVTCENAVIYFLLIRFSITDQDPISIDFHLIAPIEFSQHHRDSTHLILPSPPQALQQHVRKSLGTQ